MSFAVQYFASKSKKRNAHNPNYLGRTRLWTGIQWRADFATSHFQTCPNYLKLIKFTLKSTKGVQNLRA